MRFLCSLDGWCIVTRRVGLWWLVAVLVLLSACTTQPEWLQTKRHYPNWQFRATQVNQYSFEWEMSGDQEVLPELVFSTQNEIWLRFYPMQAFPVIMGVDAKTQREKVLKIHYNPPYVVLRAPYATLKLRGANGEEGMIWHAR